ncbi:DUF4123 domain-containing protein [Kluyvera sichuanensis]|uniref:DUF4123 domain-containing protein n=1 Tax=Kluyvera sichuanensis TaxID=2725494 RepID=UPI0039F5E876
MQNDIRVTELSSVHFDYSPQAQQVQAEKMRALIEQEMRDSTDTLFLFIDPVALVQQDDSMFRDRLVVRRPLPVSLPHQAVNVADYPWLLVLDLSRDDDRQLLDLSIAVALDELHPDKLCRKMGRSVCGWLTSSHPIEDVSKQLGHTAIQQQPSHQMMRMRYYDPAVNNILWPVLEDFRQQRVMGILSCWMLPDGDGQPVVRRHRADSALHLTFLLGLSQAQTDFILHDAGIINRALRRYRRLTTGSPRYPELTAARLISEALDRVRNHPAFQRDDEKEDLAFHILFSHPRIDQHPKIDYLLDLHTFTADVPWTVRTENITPETWQQYARECAAQEQQTSTENA